MINAAVIENGIVVALWSVNALDEYPGTELVAAPDGTMVGASYDNVAGTFINPAIVPTMEQQLAQIERDLQADISGGVMFNGTLWHSDPTFQAQLTAFVAAFAAGILAPSATVEIRSIDNVIHDLGETQVKDLAVAVMAHVQSAYAASWAAKDALMS